ncbi:MAG: sulfite exporter TauE/SafE family protein [Bergeyella zoohelcum]|nr:sulfite exporter TauE/SafE family protein [Bergeyella zoohelcum]
MEILGYICALFIGLVLGVIGGGGSILSVPVFVYLFGEDTSTATALSLFVVGITSSIGSIGLIQRKLVDFRMAILFGIPSVLGIIFSRRLILPNLPEYIINRWGIQLTKDMFILILFAILMLISSYKMIKKIHRIKIIDNEEPNYTLLISQGLLVGIVTGFIGAGGGFLIVPALVMLLRMSMKKAVATSLFIIAINSLIGFFSSIEHTEINWIFLLSFTAISVIGILIGGSISKSIEGHRLKPIFGWFVLVMAVWIIINETILK